MFALRGGATPARRSTGRVEERFQVQIYSGSIMQKSAIATLIALLGVVALAAAQPAFPLDSIKTAFAKGVVLSQTPVCSMFGSPNTDAEITLYMDMQNGRTRTVMGCGDNEMNAFMLCVPKPTLANVMCKGGNCTCMLSPFPPTCPPPSYNQSMFNYLGVKSWYGDVKADKWEVIVPNGGIVNGTSIFVYTNGAAIAGFEVFINSSPSPVTSIIFKKWQVVQPDDADFELPDTCAQNAVLRKNSKRATHPINAFIPLFNF